MSAAATRPGICSATQSSPGCSACREPLSAMPCAECTAGCKHNLCKAPVSLQEAAKHGALSRKHSCSEHSQWVACTCQHAGPTNAYTVPVFEAEHIISGGQLEGR